MGQRLSGFLDNDSPFGRLMTRCGILIGANLLFVLACLPVVTIGIALTALSFVMLRVMQSPDGVVNPFREFWVSFRRNWKQGILSWLGILLLAAVLAVDIRFCRAAGGIFFYFKIALYALAALLAIMTIYLYPVMAAFDDSLPGLMRNALFFASRRPHKMLLLAVLWAGAFLVTWLDIRMRPLIGFLWVTCGFSLLSMAAAALLWPDFREYLPKQETVEEEKPREKSPREILKEMKRLQ